MIKRILFALALLGMCFLSAPQPANAYNPFGGVDCSKAKSTAVCNNSSKSNPISGTNGVLLNIVNIVSYVAGAAAVIVIIVGAIRFVTSGSDVSIGSRIDDDVKNAKNTIAGALIGLAVIVLARTLITYLVTQL